MKKKTATVERIRELFKYDPETGYIFQVSSGRNGFKPGVQVGSIHPNGYVYVSVDRRMVPAHRAVWVLHYGEWPEGDLDHIDQNKTNNRIGNLRPATKSQNQANTIRTNAAGRRGIRISNGKFQAKIKVHKKQIHLGTYPTIDEAAHAYNKAAIIYFGDFAVLNPLGQDKDDC